MPDPREGEPVQVWASPCGRFVVLRDIVGFGIEQHRVWEGKQKRVTRHKLSDAQDWCLKQPQ